MDFFFIKSFQSTKLSLERTYWLNQSRLTSFMITSIIFINFGILGFKHLGEKITNLLNRHRPYSVHCDRSHYEIRPHLQIICLLDTTVPLYLKTKSFCLLDTIPTFFGPISTWSMRHLDSEVFRQGLQNLMLDSLNLNSEFKELKIVDNKYAVSVFQVFEQVAFDPILSLN